MRWSAPPDRREITFILLCLGAYLVCYNIEITLQTLGIDAAATKGAVLSRLGVGNTIIGEDGLRPVGWRDKLEKGIFGIWEWLPGHIMESEAAKSQRKGSGRHGAQWAARTEIEDVAGLQKPFGDSTVDDVLQHWGDNVSQTVLVNHVPGYTTLDNVFIYKKKLYFVADSDNLLPPIATILESTGAGLKEWQTINSTEARDVIGKYGSTIRGISWLHADPTPDNSTLFAFWRVHSSVAGNDLPFPRRLIFPQHSFFTNPESEPEAHIRTDTGFHPYTAKAAFPFLTVMYKEDWQDYYGMEVPFLFERLVIADRSAAGKSVKAGYPAYASALELKTSDNWWEPVRKNLALFIEGDIDNRPAKAITYIHTQGTDNAKLSDQDHKALVHALEDFGRKQGYDVSVISAEADWMSRMTSIVKSSVVVGVHGNHLLDCLFMAPGSHPTLIELFPDNAFVRDRQSAAQSIGLQYHALWMDRKFDADLPEIVAPQKDDPVSIDLSTVIRSIRSAMCYPLEC